ncbi:mucin-12-like [Hemiscyllium ocellatum]|uniref:mucin-12-like n=1 Tax=Hemiscyllium ocellatum TaxID=170820 RepID=UPI0029673D67|nr:mucin-12-like [Hemiscyllium ocellatum]
MRARAHWSLPQRPALVHWTHTNAATPRLRLLLLIQWAAAFHPRWRPPLKGVLPLVCWQSLPRQAATLLRPRDPRVAFLLAQRLSPPPPIGGADSRGRPLCFRANSQLAKRMATSVRAEVTLGLKRERYVCSSPGSNIPTLGAPCTVPHLRIPRSDTHSEHRAQFPISVSLGQTHTRSTVHSSPSPYPSVRPTLGAPRTVPHLRIPRSDTHSEHRAQFPVSVSLGQTHTRSTVHSSPSPYPSVRPTLGAPCTVPRLRIPRSDPHSEHRAQFPVSVSLGQTHTRSTVHSSPSPYPSVRPTLGAQFPVSVSLGQTHTRSTVHSSPSPHPSVRPTLGAPCTVPHLHIPRSDPHSEHRAQFPISTSLGQTHTRSTVHSSPSPYPSVRPTLGAPCTVPRLRIPQSDPHSEHRAQFPVSVSLSQTHTRSTVHSSHLRIPRSDLLSEHRAQFPISVSLGQTHTRSTVHSSHLRIPRSDLLSEHRAQFPISVSLGQTHTRSTVHSSPSPHPSVRPTLGAPCTVPHLRIPRSDPHSEHRAQFPISVSLGQTHTRSTVHSSPFPYPSVRPTLGAPCTVPHLQSSEEGLAATNWIIP